jgi:hypothetical protein
MTRFRQALLDELMTRVDDQPPASAPVPRRASRRLVLAAVGGLAAVATGGAFAATLASAPPAYALDRNPDGTVTVVFNDISDPTAINHALRDAGIRARVMLPTPASACPPAQRGNEVTYRISEAVRMDVRLHEDGGRRVNVARLRPDDIPTGTITVFMPTQQRPRDHFGPDLWVRSFRQPGPTCVVARG